MAATVPSNPPDAELIAGILAGDSESFETLHNRYERRIYFFALKRMGNPCGPRVFHCPRIQHIFTRVRTKQTAIKREH